MSLNRRRQALAIAFLLSSAVSVLVAQTTQTAPPAQTPAQEPALTWRDVTQWGVEGTIRNISWFRR